jgi:hypothetical protein
MLSVRYWFRNSAGVYPAKAAYFVRAAEFSGVSLLVVFMIEAGVPIAIGLSLHHFFIVQTFSKLPIELSIPDVPSFAAI